MYDPPKKGGSNGGRPQSKLTTTEADWLAAVSPVSIAFIEVQDEAITRQNAEDILSGQVLTLSKKGFQSLYSKKTKKAVSKGLVLTDDDNLAILKNRLRKRVLDFFRNRRTQKAGYVRPLCDCGMKRCKCESRESGFSRIVEISEDRWNQIPDEREQYESERRMAGDGLDELNLRLRSRLNSQQQAILEAAIRNPKGQFKRTPLYEAMTDKERNLFLPKDGALVVDEKERIKKAIAARTAEVRRLIRKIIADDPGKGECYGA